MPLEQHHLLPGFRECACDGKADDPAANHCRFDVRGHAHPSAPIMCSEAVIHS